MFNQDAYMHAYTSRLASMYVLRGYSPLDINNLWPKDHLKYAEDYEYAQAFEQRRVEAIKLPVQALVVATCQVVLITLVSNEQIFSTLSSENYAFP